MTVKATIAKQALTKAISKSELQNKPIRGEGAFKDVLNNMQSATEFAERLGLTSNSMDPMGSMRTLSAEQIDFTPAKEVTEVTNPEVSKRVVNMLSEVNHDQMQMDNLVNQILYSGRKFNPQELLAIQAQVHHYAQMTELTVKMAEHGVQSVKQVLNTQVS